MLQCFKQLIDEGLMDQACLSYDTASWQQAFTTGHAFITHDKAFQLDNLEAAGKQANPEFTLSWFNNIPMVESDLPYQTRDNAVQTYCWFITSLIHCKWVFRNCPIVLFLTMRLFFLLLTQ